MLLPGVDWALPLQLLSKKMHTDLPTGQFDGSIFSGAIPSSRLPSTRGKGEVHSKLVGDY